ncbi:unnamed protein product, partial [Ectocarpus sp. 12 AP-2014]
MAAAGQTRCLDAFIVAWSQACAGGEKRWYKSTLELQLTSLEICRACRSASILHVHVYHQTATRLWSCGETQPSTR